METANGEKRRPPSAHPFATFSSPYSIFNGPSGLLHLLLAFTNLPYLKLKCSHFQVIGNRMARMTVVYSGQSPCFTSPLDFGGFGFALGSGGFRPQMYKIVALEEESICHCKKKKEKKKEKKHKGCKCGCDDVNQSRLLYIPDPAMQLATLLPL